MSQIENNLAPSEQVIYRSRLHWMVLAPTLVVALIVTMLCVLGLAAPSSGSANAEHSANEPFILAILFAILIVAIAVMRWDTTEFAVTNKRVIRKTGIVGRRLLEIPLAKIESIELDQSVFGRLFGYGTLLLRGTGGTPERFVKLSSPMEFRHQCQIQIDRAQSADFLRPRN